MGIENLEKWLLWSFGAIGTLFVSGMGGAWAVRGKYDDIKKSTESHEERLNRLDIAINEVREIKSDVSYIKGVIDAQRRATN